MESDRDTHRVYKALHRPLTVWGVDRRLFFLALMMGAAMFNLFYSFLAALLTFASLYVFARWSTTRDPQMLRILLSSSRLRARYDAAKHTPTRGDGKSVTYDPRRLQGVTVYREVERTFAVGDRVQFTAPFRTAKIANREMGTIAAMTDRQDMRVRTDTGKTVTFSVDPAADGPRAHRHVDHGYAVTSYSSQGLTADRVLLYIDSEQAGERLVNQRLAYVALSRGRHDAQIYTDDRDRLSTALSRDVSKSSAHAVRSAEQTPHRDRSPSRQSSLGHTTTIVAGMTRISGERERTVADAMPRSPGPRLSAEELQRAGKPIDLPTSSCTTLDGRQDGDANYSIRRRRSPFLAY